MLKRFSYLFLVTSALATPSFAEPKVEDLTRLLAVTRSEMQEMKGIIEAQKKKIAELENKVQELKAADVDLAKAERLDVRFCPKVSFSDAGYIDKHRGLYNVDGCIVYCRWVGNSGSGGDPAVKTVHGTSFWACADGQEYKKFDSFPYRAVSFVDR